MQGIRVISKGNYSRPQLDNIVSLKQYMFVDGGNKKKFLLLNLSNDRNETLTRLKLCIIQYDANGQELNTTLADSGSLSIKARTSFSFNKKIELLPNCVDFKMRVLDAGYGNYSYSDAGVEAVVTYNKAKNVEDGEVASGAHSVVVKQRNCIRPFMLTIVSAICIVCAIVAMFISITAYKSVQTDFVLDGVGYRFVNGNNGAGSEIQVVSYDGSEANIVISEYLNDYRVVSIGENAFYGNKKMKTLSIYGNIEICDGAFAYCTNLESMEIFDVEKIGYASFEQCVSLKEIEFINTREIGEWAFNSCKGLEKVEFSSSDVIDANNLPQIKIGAYAFCDCTNLKDFSSYIDTNFDGSAQLKNCYAIENLRLNNYNYTDEALGLSAAGESKISSLFGDNYTLPKTKSLKTIYIENIDAISSKFCFNLTIESIEIKNLKSSIIYDEAFSGCENLKDIKLPIAITEIKREGLKDTSITTLNLESIESLGDGAFAGCKRLITAKIPSTATKVGKNMFNGCVKLATIEFADSDKIVEIGDGAFTDCQSLRGFELPKNVEILGEAAFKNCSSLKRIKFGEKLTTIGKECFSGCSLFTTLVIPDTVTSLGELALANMSSLTELTVPFIGVTNDGMTNMATVFGTDGNFESFEKLTVSKITQLSAGAFKDCDFINTIVIPDTVTAFGDESFMNCKKLKNLNFPSKLTTIGTSVFAGCESLTKIDISMLKDVPNSMFAGCKALEKVTFSEDMTSLGKNVFYGCEKMTEIVLNDKIETIDEGCFENCTSLEKFVVPDSVLVLGSGILKGCTSLKELTIPFVGVSSNSSLADKLFLGFEFGATTSEEATDLVPQSLEKLVIKNIQTIDASTFNGCQNIKELVMGDGATAIAENTFKDFANLTAITLPSTLTSIDSTAFLNCFKLYEIDNKSTLTITPRSGVNGEIGYNALAVYDDEADKKLKRVTTYDDFEFAGVKVGDKVAGENEAWYLTACPETEDVEIPYYFDYYYNRFSSRMISEFGLVNGLFKDNQNIKNLSVTLPVTSVGDYLCSGAKNLQTVSFAHALNVKTIGAESFADCILLKTVDLPSNLEAIDEKAFHNDISIEEIELPSTLNLIDTNAFEGCVRLFAVLNKSGLDIVKKSTNNGMVAYYAQVVSDTAMQTETMISDDGFVFKSGGSKWYLTSYNGEGGAILLSQKVVRSENVNYSYQISTYEIAPYAFAGNANITEIEADNSVTAISSSAFESSSALTKIDFSNDVIAEISDYAFYNCSALETVKLPINLNYIADSAFGNDNNIKDIFTPSFTTVEANAFARSENQYNSVRILFYDKEKSYTSGSYYGMFSNVAAYYWAECVHDNDSWTFDKDGNVSTDFSLTETVESEATCTKTGSESSVCDICGEKLASVDLPMIPHKFEKQESGDYQCSVCHQTVELINEDTYKAKTYFQNDYKIPYTIIGNQIISNNTSYISTSSLTIIAPKDCIVDFDFLYNYNESYGKLTAKINGVSTPVTTYDSRAGKFQVSLSENDTLVLTYTSYSSYYQVNSVTISNLALMQPAD